jgi:hypothetical protein
VNLTIRHDAGGYIEHLTQPLTVPGGGTQRINFTWTAMNSQTYGPRSEAFSVVNLSAQLLFDTGHGTYPSISGRHNGTIRPNETIALHALYTYPCAGTGGHTEYAKIYNESWGIETLPWTGYRDDWHNRSFNKTFTLYANETYNYTIRTGSTRRASTDRRQTSLT